MYEYHDNGVLKQEYLINRKTKKLNGIYLSYNRTGVLVEETNFINGIEHGIYKSYYEDGSIKNVRKVNNSKFVDTSFFYTRDSTLDFIRIFTVKDSADYTEVQYYPNQKIAFVATVYDTIAKGDEFEFYENGKLKYYKFRNKFGELTFLKKYNLDNTESVNKGLSIFSHIKHLASDSVNIELETAIPPHNEAYLKMLVINNVTLDTLTYKDITVSSNLYSFRYLPKEETKISFLYNLQDTLLDESISTELYYNYLDFFE